MRPAVSFFVQTPSDANIPLAHIVNTAPRELAEMERLRRRSLQPNAGPFGSEAQFQLQQILATGLNLPEAWFEWTMNQPVDHATYRKLREVFLAKNAGQVFTRDQVLEKVWGYDFFGGQRTVDVHMRWLREKLEDTPGRPKQLLTVRGVGYSLRLPR